MWHKRFVALCWRLARTTVLQFLSYVIGKLFFMIFFFFSFCLLVQTWRRSSLTSTPSVMERHHTEVEELVSTDRNRSIIKAVFLKMFPLHPKVPRDSDQTWPLTANLSSRPGESVHVVPGPPQRPPDLHVPS